MSLNVTPLYPDGGISAALVQGFPISTIDPVENQVLVYREATRQWTPVTNVYNLGTAASRDVGQRETNVVGIDSDGAITLGIPADGSPGTLSLYDAGSMTYFSISPSNNELALKNFNIGSISGNIVRLRDTNLTDERIFELPDASGTIALTSQLSTFGTGVATALALATTVDGSIALRGATITKTGSAGPNGTNLGGSGAVGLGGNSPVPNVSVAGGFGGDNSVSGTGSGGAATTFGVCTLFSVSAGSGGAANGNFSGGNAGNSMSSTGGLITFSIGSGGNASAGANGANGGNLSNGSSGGLFSLRSGSAGAGSSTGTGIGGAGGNAIGSGSFVNRVSAGSGGAGAGNFSGGSGGACLSNFNSSIFVTVGGNGGSAGSGGAGGAGGGVLTAPNASGIRMEGGNGGNGGVGGAGGQGGGMVPTRLSFIGGAGGNAGSAAGESGGAGGGPGTIVLNGAPGGVGTGGFSGGAGGTGGIINLTGTPAVGATAGLNAPHILSGLGSPEGVTTAPVGSLFLRMDGGALTTLYVKESGTGNTGWAAK